MAAKLSFAQEILSKNMKKKINPLSSFWDHWTISIDFAERNFVLAIILVPRDRFFHGFESELFLYYLHSNHLGAWNLTELQIYVSS